MALVVMGVVEVLINPGGEFDQNRWFKEVCKSQSLACTLNLNLPQGLTGKMR